MVPDASTIRLTKHRMVGFYRSSLYNWNIFYHYNACIYRILYNYIYIWYHMIIIITTGLHMIQKRSSGWPEVSVGHLDCRMAGVLDSANWLGHHAADASDQGVFLLWMRGQFHWILHSLCMFMLIWVVEYGWIWPTFACWGMSCTSTMALERVEALWTRSMPETQSEPYTTIPSIEEKSCTIIFFIVELWLKL